MREAPLKRIRCNPDVVWADLDGELVLLEMGTGAYYGLNRVGTEIWHLLAQDCPPETILDYIVKNYDTGLGQAKGDFDAFIEALLASGLVWTEASDGG